MTRRWTRCDGVMATDLGDEIVVLNSKSRAMHTLNETGRVVWTCAEDGLDVVVEQLCTDVRHRRRHRPQRRHRAARRTRRQGPPRRARLTWNCGSSDDAWSSTSTTTTSCSGSPSTGTSRPPARALDAEFTIEVTAGRSSASPDLTFDEPDGIVTLTLTGDGAAIGIAGTPFRAWNQLYRAIAEAMLASGVVLLHAAVITRGDRTMALCAPRASGSRPRRWPQRRVGGHRSPRTSPGSTPTTLLIVGGDRRINLREPSLTSWTSSIPASTPVGPDASSTR